MTKRALARLKTPVIASTRLCDRPSTMQSKPATQRQSYSAGSWSGGQTARQVACAQTGHLRQPQSPAIAIELVGAYPPLAAWAAGLE